MNLDVPSEELERFSLYDLALKKREERESPPITRLLYVVYFSEAALQKIDIEQVIKQQLEQIKQPESLNTQEPRHISTVSGFLMLKGLFSLHLVESDSEFIQNWIKIIWEEFKKERSVYQIINIITFTEDNPQRIFDKWYCENLFQSGPQLTEMDKTDQQCLERVWDLYQQICSAGLKHVQKSAKEKQIAKLSNDIPLSLDDINMLLHKRFMSISEYVSLYVEEVQIELDSEMLYPQSPSLTRCLEFWDNGKVEI